MITTRPATPADLALFYPDFTCSFRAWTALLDQAPKGIIGLALTLPVAFLFSNFEPELRPHLRRPGIMHLIRQTRDTIRKSRVPVWAVAQDDEPDAPRILQRLGLTYKGVLEGHVIYEYLPGRA